MKLARKLSFALFLGVLAVLVAFAYVSLRWQIALYDEDMRQDHRRMGLILRPSLAETWRKEGEARLLDMVRLTDAERPRINLRWVWLDGTEPSAPAEMPAATDLRPLVRGEVVQLAGRMPVFGEDDFIVTYVPVVESGGRIGALEMGESLADKSAYIRANLLTTLAALLAVALVSAGVAMGIGRWFVGTPITQLIDKARRVGAGDFSGPLALPRTDEIGELGHELNAMCDRLASALEQARHTDRLSTIGKLTSVIAHEIGTPLNVISGHARLIARGKVAGASAGDSATIITEQCARMTNLVRQVLDYGRRRGPRKKSTRLGDIVQATIDFLEPLRAKSGVIVDVQQVDGAEATAEVDPTQVQQALTNLIVNAIQASAEGGTVEVSLDAVTRSPPGDSGRPREYYRISVVDHGSGISREDLARIFEPFFTTKEAGEGTGLGLSIAREIVAEHGGFLDAKSELGSGSRFEIHLPATELG